MFTVSIETRFSASHQLSLPDGSKELLHRHNWAVTVKVSNNKLTGEGVVMDFSQLRTMTDNIVAGFHNSQLDKFAYFQRNSPSAENVAQYIYMELEPKLPEGISLDCVEVVEEPGCSAKFSK